MQVKGRIRWLAVLVGYLCDYVISGIVSLIAFSVNPALEQAPLFGSVGTVSVGLGLTLGTIIGGFVAARIAREERFLHGFLVGGVGIVTALLLSFGGFQLPLDDMLRHFAATLLGGVAGYFSDRLPIRQREK